MPYIFEHFDRDGEKVEVYHDGDGERLRIINIHGDDRRRVAVYLDTRSAVDRLRAALAPYGTVEAAKPADVIEVGREYRLLPGAAYCRGDRSEMPEEGTTRVRVASGPDSDGDYRVTPLDGATATDSGFIDRFVHGDYLAPASAEATASDPTPLDPRRVAAIDKAAEILTEHFDEVDTFDVQSVAAFLLGEAA